MAATRTYVMLYRPDHPLAPPCGVLAEHRMVVHDAGIEIPPGYDVHHKNEDPRDNRLENLEVLPRGTHLRRHSRDTTSSLPRPPRRGRGGNTGARGRPSTLERRFEERTLEGPLADLRPELGPCLLWTGRCREGYPVIARGDTTIPGAHAAWEIALGERLPKGFVLRRFACSLTTCVRAEHWRPWVASEDLDHDRILIAWNARHDECLRGHSFLEPRNVIVVPGGRSCRLCRRLVARQRRERDGSR